jgi:muconate cycloisomerase
MKIIEVECRLVRLPSRRPHRWASLTAEVGSYVLVRIRTDEGVEGWGEATALAQWGGDHGRYYGETPGTVLHVLKDVFGPFLIGADIDDRHKLYEEMDGAIRGHHYAKTALEEAMLDVVARSVGIPVYELIGGRRRDRVPMAHSLGLLPTEQLLDEVSAAVAEGVRTIKLKVGEDPERDIDVVDQVRHAIGFEVDLVVDANQGWGKPAEAARVIRRLDQHALRYVEQPVAGIREMAWLADSVSVPLMVDESMWTAHDLVDVAVNRSASLASIYTSKAGGLTKAMQIDAVASAFGIGTNVNGSGETGVGNLANVHLAASLTSLTEASVFPVTGMSGNRSTEIVGAMYTDDVLEEPLQFEDGCVVVPEGPGWGLKIDREKIESFTVEHVVVRGD